jgi:hypothetical protein
MIAMSFFPFLSISPRLKRAPGRVLRAPRLEPCGSKQGAPQNYFLKASFTFSPACFKLPAA